VYAPGIYALYETLSTIAKVTVVAPDRDRSASGKSLTVSTPIRPKTLDNGFVSVDGTPTDCVHYALSSFMEDKPDLIVSGINAGANLGDDVLYSGTVAAATEGNGFGFPAIAVSLTGELTKDSYTKAGIIVKNLILDIKSELIIRNNIINVNIPDLSDQNMGIKGYKVTRLGKRHNVKEMLEMRDPCGEPVYWIGPPAKEQDSGEGTDFQAIRDGYVSITPLQMDLTNYDNLDIVSAWINK
jgi:5'-nucleotidase